MIFDSHCHLGDYTDIGSTILQAEQAGVHGWLSSAVSGASALRLLEPNNHKVLICAGLHPFYPHSNFEDLSLFCSLAQAGKLYAWGEIGLDKRDPDWPNQIPLLLQQLDLARGYNLPVVLHCVQAWADLAQLLKKNFPSLTYLLHGAKALPEICALFAGLNIAYSLGPRFIKPRYTFALKKVVREQPWALESDAPHGCAANELPALAARLRELTGLPATALPAGPPF